MKIPKIKPVYFVVIIILILIAIFITLFLASKKLPPATSPTKTTTPATQQARITPQPSPVGYEIAKPVLVNDIIFWTQKDVLEYYGLNAKQVTNPDFPATDSNYIVEEVAPLDGQTDKIALLLQNLKDSSLQYAIFDLNLKQVTIKFTERLKSVSWQKDQQKLLGYALSSTNEPYFLTSSLDAKDQKAIIKTGDTNVTPLLLTDKALVYQTDKTIKKIDLEKKEVSDVATDVIEALVSADGSIAAYTTNKGLFAITKPGMQKINVSQTLPSFFNWSNGSLMFGIKTQNGVKITRWNNSAKQLLTLATIPFDDIVQSVEAAFEDKINNKLIYWSGGFLYETALKTP